MECFIKNIFQGSVDEEAHRQFVRFGKGNYAGRAVLSLHKTKKIKLKGSFEYANDFVNLVSELENVKFSGVVLSKEKLGLGNEKKKSGIYSYEVEIDSEKVKELKNKVYYFLLDADSENIKLIIRKKLPKPGKVGKKKVDDSFCEIEADLKYYPVLKEAFFWDVPDCKKCKVSHEYEITDLIYPEGEKDFEKIRLMTKRKGKIIRRLEVDGGGRVGEKEFEA